MRSTPGELSCSPLTIHSQVHIALVSLIGRYRSILSCSTSLFSFRYPYASSPLFHGTHVSLILIYALHDNSTSAALSHRHLLAVLVPLLVYFLLLSYVPLPDGLVSSGISDTFTLVTARYNVLGTFILGCLSGFGSVTTAWGYFPLSFGKNRHVNHLQ